MKAVNSNIRDMLSSLKGSIAELQLDEEVRQECFAKLKRLKKRLEGAAVACFMKLCKFETANQDRDLANAKDVKDWLCEECDDLLDVHTKFW
jgi:hypothetical protein